MLCSGGALGSKAPPIACLTPPAGPTPIFGTEDLAPTDWVWDHKGGFCEHVFTGTGFPKVFYLRYNMYRHYFPVMALARYVNVVRTAD